MGLYDTDYVEWAQQTAELIRAGRVGEVDLENVAEEIESLGKSDRRQLRNRIRTLLVHLLKAGAAAGGASSSWSATIVEQRTRIENLLADSPSLRVGLSEIIGAAYPTAVEIAALQMQMDATSFPRECPYTPDEILATGFLPTRQK